MAEADKTKPKPKFNRKLIPVVLIVVIAGVLLYNYIQQVRADNAPPDGSGTVEATEIEVASQVAGRITTLSIAEGQTVKKGQVIARLDDTDYRAQLAQAVGQRDAALNTYRNIQQGSRVQQIAAAQAQVAAAESAYEGAQKGLATSDIGLNRVTDLRTAVITAQAQVNGLTAQLAAARQTAAAAGATASGAGQTLSTAQQGLKSVTDLQQARDAAQGQLDTARANRERAVTALSTSSADYDRVSSLYNEGAVAKRDLDNAKLALDTAKTGLDTADAQVSTAQAAVQNTTTALNERLSARQQVISAQTSRTATSRQRNAAEQQVRQTAAQLDGARRTLANAQIAYGDRLQARSQRDVSQTQVETTRAQVENAKQNLALLQAGNTKASIQAARGQYEAALGAVAAARKHLTETEIVAPEDGPISTIVTYAGETVSAGLPVVKMLDLKHAYVRIYLPFHAFGKVKVGDEANIDTDAIPGQTFKGHVSEVATEAEFTPKNVETRDQRLQQVYWVKVMFDNANGQMKPGMPAHATLPNR